MEDMRKPDISLMHLEQIDASIFDDFRNSVAADDLDLRIEAKPDPGPFMGLEWLMPTAIVAYIAHSYFDTFLKEAGKDHYRILKGALSRLASRFFGKDAPVGRVVFSAGKAESEIPRYSIFYSIVADLGNGLYVKLLLQTDFDAAQCNEAQSAFLSFLSAAHDDTLDLASVKGLVGHEPIGRTLLLAYNLADKALEVVDPLAGKRRVGA